MSTDEKKPKEFDEVAVPADKEAVERYLGRKKKEEPKLETFNPPKEKDKPKTDWEKFFEKENEKYGKVVKEKAEKETWMLPIMNGDAKAVDTPFSRNIDLTVGELRKLNSLQKKYDEVQKKDTASLFQAEAIASLYFDFAELLLVNDDTGERMTKEQFEAQKWTNIRPILDNCILKSIIASTG